MLNNTANTIALKYLQAKNQVKYAIQVAPNEVIIKYIVAVLLINNTFS